MKAATDVIAEGKDEESVVTMSMKSLTAAGKFKKRRNKDENHKKSVEVSQFPNNLHISDTFLKRLLSIISLFGLINHKLWSES